MAEKAGIPAVSIVAEQFVGLAKTVVQGVGLPSLATVAMPHGVMSGAIEDAWSACETAAQEIVMALTRWRPEGAGRKEEELVFEGRDYQDTIDKMNSFFLLKMWSDGLPLVPPTKERVQWMLTGTQLPADRVLTTKFGPRYGSITVENVAINAVMAGSRPEYMPVILSSIDLLSTESAKELLFFIQMSVGMFAPVTIINGPIAKELKINSSFGLMGPGWQANATIGRSIGLVLINGAGGYAGPGGHPSGQSLPGRFTWCFAENEEENPWGPLHSELGYTGDTSTVTIMAGRGTQTIMAHAPAEKVLGSIAHALQGVTISRYAVPWDQLLILSPAHARLLADGGFSKQDIQTFVYEKARLSVAEAEALGLELSSLEWAQRLAKGDDKNTFVPMIEKPEDLVIVVAGGTGSDNSTLVPCLGKKVSVEIDKYKPEHWKG